MSASQLPTHWMPLVQATSTGTDMKPLATAPTSQSPGSGCYAQAQSSSHALSDLTQQLADRDAELRILMDELEQLRHDNRQLAAKLLHSGGSLSPRSGAARGTAGLSLFDRSAGDVQLQAALGDVAALTQQVQSLQDKLAEQTSHAEQSVQENEDVARMLTTLEAQVSWRGLCVFVYCQHSFAK